MATENDSDIMIATRVNRSLYVKIQRRRREIKRLTGIEPSVSAIVRAMIEEATLEDKPVRRRHHRAA
jgi:hypothetical protein